ncbi:hypothetical protein BSL82_11760 [Tardibacter chloracetimidivorans]|uniref:HTH tetR-type domain-containing protein n=1 Tax=Tardibacter chloracetimidivorans TaxID=1921510 RepID=A0A1L3ZW92_9SPHN|nr:TetR/AcrR family transcriptional regulator [Tardibacter chloracetimidivorans]API59902.1 hypothetical protein BSL82_11760 [Tardibacter chloracetimidivorans]
MATQASGTKDLKKKRVGGGARPRADLPAQDEYSTEFNKHGQKLGEKGRRTREALTNAARQLLRESSPLDLSAVAISRQAEVSSASFYMYFNSVRDMLYQMNEAISEEIAELVPFLTRKWDDEDPAADALKFVKKFQEIWSQHREVLMFRNMEADLGNPQFDKLWRATLRPLVARIGDKIKEQAQTKGKFISVLDSRSRAVVLTSALERIAACDVRVINEELGMDRVQNSLADMIVKAIYCVE